MRLRNPWFGGFSFLGAILMICLACASVVDYCKGGDTSTIAVITAIILSGMFSAMAVCYFWMSLNVGDTLRRSKRFSNNNFGVCGTAALGCPGQFRTAEGNCATSYSWTIAKELQKREKRQNEAS
jgi:hypothetical protein